MRGLAIALIFVGCSQKGPGEPCEKDSNCQSGYVCFQGTCMTGKSRDQALTTQSGVGSAPIERPVVGGDRVRVRVTNGEGTIFAACEATERLVGGGCTGGENCASDSTCGYLRSYPGNFSPEDTLGARWYCAGVTGMVRAYALCQQSSEATVVAPEVPADAGVPAD